MKRFIAGTMALAMVIPAVGCGNSGGGSSGGGSGVDMEKAYEQVKQEFIDDYLEKNPNTESDPGNLFEKNVELAPDRSFIKVSADFTSTIGKSEADKDFYDYMNKIYGQRCAFAEEHFNSALGLPASLWEKMQHTSGKDGKQTEEFDNIKVTWSYNANSGIYALYEKK